MMKTGLLEVCRAVLEDAARQIKAEMAERGIKYVYKGDEERFCIVLDPDGMEAGKGDTYIVEGDNAKRLNIVWPMFRDGVEVEGFDFTVETYLPTPQEVAEPQSHYPGEEKKPMFTLAPEGEKPPKPTEEEYTDRWPTCSRLAVYLEELKDGNNLTSKKVAALINTSPKLVEKGRAKNPVSASQLNSTRRRDPVYNEEGNKWGPPMREIKAEAIIEILTDLTLIKPEKKV